MGFKQAACDPYLYVASKGEMFIVAVYADDIAVGICTSFAEHQNKPPMPIREALNLCTFGSCHQFQGE